MQPSNDNAQAQSRERRVKKLRYTCLFGLIEVIETLLRSGTKTIRPLRVELGLSAWSYSRHLQRLMVDFGAELPEKAC